jgi:hypothetical protein
MKYKSILIVTYGRSGSTLLQGVLNGIEGCLVRGENSNFIFHLYQSYENLRKAKARKGAAPHEPWYGAPMLDEALFLDRIRELVKGLLLAGADETRVKAYGFKEIRYPDVMDDLAAYLDFLERLFPTPAFIFNTRNMDKVLRSEWWARMNPWKAKRLLLDFEQKCFAYMRDKPNCFHIRYEDVVEKTDNLEKMFEFLGAVCDPAEVDRILKMPHGYRHYAETGRISLLRWFFRSFKRNLLGRD